MLKPRVVETMETIVRHYEGIEARFSKIALERKVSVCQQFIAIFKRNMTYLLRNPRTIQSMFMNAILIAVFYLCTYWHMGDPDPYTPTAQRQMIANFKGLSFLLTNSLFYPAILLVVIQMPLQVPVFQRELMNKMYLPSPYFFGRMLSHILLQIASPLIFSLIIYFGLETYTSFSKFIQFCVIGIEINLVGCTLGYLCGVTFNNEEAARQIAQLVMILFHLLSGGLSNPNQYNAFVNILQYISSNRYAVELYFRVMTYNEPHFCDSTDASADCIGSREAVLQQLGFTIGDVQCHVILAAFIIIFTFLGWFVINRKNKKFI